MNNQMDMECERCSGILIYTKNSQGEEVESCSFCGLLRGIRLDENNNLRSFNMDGAGYYRLTTKDGSVETNTIPKEELTECIEVFEKLLKDERVDENESYLSVYNEKEHKYEIKLGSIDKYSQAILNKWEEVEALF